MLNPKRVALILLAGLGLDLMLYALVAWICLDFNPLNWMRGDDRAYFVRFFVGILWLGMPPALGAANWTWLHVWGPDDKPWDGPQ